MHLDNRRVEKAMLEPGTAAATTHLPDASLRRSATGSGTDWVAGTEFLPALVSECAIA